MYCRVYLPASILAWGSELRLSRRMIILAFDLGSESSTSACREAVVRLYPGTSIGFGIRTCSSSTEAASIRPEKLSAAASRENALWVRTIDPRYLR